MAKRLIDTDIFKKGFVKGLEAPYKLLWLYIINECNHAGIWEVELEIAEIRLGVKFETDPVKIFGEKVKVFDNSTKWFIPSFIEFQYGELRPENRAHLSVIQILQRYKLINKENKPLRSPLQGAKDMDKDKDKDMDKDKKESGISLFEQTLTDFYAMRVRIKKPATDRAKELILKELQKLAPNNEPLKIKIIEQSIRNGWQDVFALRSNKDKDPLSSESITDAWKYLEDEQN